MKRKREEEEEHVEEKATNDVVEMRVDPVPEVHVDALRQTKRARTTMGTVAQTAAAMAVGAVVTWSALAYV